MTEKCRYYWLYANGKTVKEITREKWQKMLAKDRLKEYDLHLLVQVHPSEVYFRKGRRSFWVSRKQLEQILNIKSENVK